MVYFVDTNIFLRFFTRDQERQYQACRQLFLKAKQGKIKLTTSALVIFELIWTLSSYYQEEKEAIIEQIISILEFPNLKIENKKLFLGALALWQQQNIEFSDVFNYVWMKQKQIRRLYSFDKHFDRLADIDRIKL